MTMLVIDEKKYMGMICRLNCPDHEGECENVRGICPIWNKAKKDIESKTITPKEIEEYCKSWCKWNWRVGISKERKCKDCLVKRFKGKD